MTRRTIQNIIQMILVLLVISNNVDAQQLERILHLRGKVVINGIGVTVSSNGKIDSLHYCGEDTGPYYIGYNYARPGAGDGSYTFNFSQPVNEVVVNFSALSHSNSYGEEARIFINGEHYKVKSIGTNNSCGESDLIITSESDLRPCYNCSGSGTNGIRIKGPIKSLTIECNILSGEPMGFVAGVWFNGQGKEIDTFMPSYAVQIGENTAGLGKEIIIEGDLQNTDIQLNDSNSKAISIQYRSKDKFRILIDASTLLPGNYILQIKKNNQIEKQILSIP